MLSYKSGIKYAQYNASELVKKVKIVRPFDFSKNTTYGLGGNAPVCYYPKNIPQAVAVYRFLENAGTDYVTVGCGSNILASDAPYRGAVVSTRALRGIVRPDDHTLFCLAGTTVSQLLGYCKRNLIGGLEYLYGIPATIGGITFMNGGAGNIYINSNVIAVKVFNGKLANLSNKNCNFSYKHSTMRDINSPILGVFLSVQANNRQWIDERIDHYKSARAHLPKGKSCGCVFKNPKGVSAGKLIEGAGLKGARVGGAVVSQSHANFILNQNATSEDVARLIAYVKRCVFEKFGIALEEEVVYIGEFHDFDS